VASGAAGADERFNRLESPWRVAFEEAWTSWRAGSLGIGAALADEDGVVVAAGRNRVLETGSDAPLAGSLLGHAEMTAFADLGLRTGRGLTLYTTVEPCLMCASTAIAMRARCVRYAAPDPVFDGLEDLLAMHSYMDGRMPRREQLDDPTLAAFAALLPLANRVWSRPGSPPRAEWIEAHRPLWEAAAAAVPTLTRLQHESAGVAEAIRAVGPLLPVDGTSPV
jgi:tRNA(adenine34) deaminase